MNDYYTLGIESTCDETGCAILCNEQILANVVASQIDLHTEYGGVVPELACRRHIDLIIPVVDEALQQAGIPLSKIDLIAVAQGPGLVGAIMVGLNCAKTLAWTLGKPLIAVNHIEAHLFAALMHQKTPAAYPCIGAVLSGGHTALVHITQPGVYQLIGQTVDDAIGEAFDKVARMLGLPYPGGPVIEALARQGDPKKYPLRAGSVKGHPLSFSFSGLKTAVLYTAKGKGAKPGSELLLPQSELPHLAASFQQAALEDIVLKVHKAAEMKGCKTILFGGGVTANQRLREMFAAHSQFTYHWPEKGLILDNAAMIAGLGLQKFRQQSKGAPLEIEAMPNMPFT